jgi:hypothetical protein
MGGPWPRMMSPCCQNQGAPSPDLHRAAPKKAKGSGLVSLGLAANPSSNIDRGVGQEQRWTMQSATPPATCGQC